LRSGADVVISGRRQETLDKAAEELVKAVTECAGRQIESKVHRVLGDAGTASGCAQIAEKISAIGPLSVLVNNLGIFCEKAACEITDDEWLEMFQVNVLSVVRMTRAFLPAMLKANRGRIINIGSDTAIRPNPAYLHYSATKACVANLTVGFADITRGTNVTVNAIQSGPAGTEAIPDYLAGLWRRDQAAKAAPDSKLVESAAAAPSFDELSAEFFRKYEPHSLLQRFIRPHELADTALFLASDSAVHINGTNLRCEGGILRFI